ncbi:hypothetical protein [Paenibacillus chungangensis]|uniref:Uncharacterized protein n=1 Tax=Paenibacillus chungangensis TaxID=696535 RepID=A0ABW3HJS9_9BACL
MNLPLGPGLLLRITSIGGSNTLPLGEERLATHKKPAAVICDRLFVLGDAHSAPDEFIS